jgi:hypothetical protein
MVQLPGSTLILVAGGTTDGTTALKTAELYDTVNNTWRTTGEMKTARRGHTATVLQNGKILVVGGNDGVNTLATAETYDPTAGVWTNTIGPLAQVPHRDFAKQWQGVDCWWHSWSAWHSRCKIHRGLLTYSRHI